MRIKPIAIAFLLGGITSVLMLATALAFGGNQIGPSLILFGTPAAFVIDALTPTSFWYWLVPEGGGASAAMLFAVSVWLQLTIILAAIGYALWHIRKEKIKLNA